MKHSYRRYLLTSLAVISTVPITGCGKKAGDVTVESATFNTSGEALLAREKLNPNSEALARFYPDEIVAAVSPTTTVTDFKICVRKVKLENEDGKTEQKDDQDEIEFKPGLIDLTAGTAKSWGTMNVPVGFKLKKIKIKVKKDKDLCGVDYSIKFNSATTDQDVEFKWKFEPAIDLDAGNKLSLALATVVSALRQAGDAGTLSSLKDHVENTEGSGSKN